MTNHNITPEERKLIADRLKTWINSLPERERNLPFFHALGVSLTPEEMLKEVEGASQLGDIIADMELKKLEQYQP